MHRVRALAARGVLRIGGGRVGVRAIDQVATIILARILSPRDFGLVALASSLIGFLRTLGYVELSRGIVQRREIDEGHLSTAFWASLGSGAALVVIVGAVSPWLGAFARDPLVGRVAFALSFGFVIASASVVQAQVLARRFNYGALALGSVVGTLAGGVVGIGMALLGFGVWSIVGQILTTGAASMIVLSIAAGWTPRFHFSRPKFLDLWSFGAPLLVAIVLGYIVRNVDNVLIGRYVGSAALGLYALGYAISLAPILDFGIVLHDVMFSILSRLQDEADRLKRAFLVATGQFTVIALPTMMGLSLVAALLVEVLFGAKWLGAAPVISLLALAGFLQLPTILGPSGLQAAGRSDVSLQWTALSAALYPLAFVVGVRWGIVGVAVGYLAASVVSLPVRHLLISRIIGATAADVWRVASPGVIGSLIMAVCLLPARTVLMASGLPRVLILGAVIVLGVVVYFTAVWFIRREAVLGLVRMVGESLSSLHRPRLREEVEI